MARGDYDTTPAEFLSTSPGLTSAPITLSCWFYLNSLTASSILLYVSDTFIGQHYLQVRPAGTETLRASSTVNYSESGTTVSTGQWYHAAGVWASTTSRIVYLNGVAGAEDTASRTTSTLERLSIGSSYTGSSPTDGYVAEAAVWNAALAAADIASLAKGFSPHLVRRGNLVHHTPLIRSDSSVVGSVSASGAVGVFPHPPILGAIAS